MTLEPELQRRFREGFHPDRPAGWLEHLTDQQGNCALDVAGHLERLRRGQRDFDYPGGHDRTAYRVLGRLVRDHALRRGADIGSASGVYPAIQLHHGVEQVTVFEVRPRESDHPAVRVLLHDLSREPWDAEPFDLVTCMSTIEHVGLGRYGDPLDPEGDIQLFGRLRPLVRAGGFLVVSFPEGPPCIHFNLHRVYSAHRRDRMFAGFRIVRRVESRSPWKRIWHKLRGRERRLGWLHQPIYVLAPD